MFKILNKINNKILAFNKNKQILIKTNQILEFKLQIN